MLNWLSGRSIAIACTMLLPTATAQAELDGDALGKALDALNSSRSEPREERVCRNAINRRGGVTSDARYGMGGMRSSVNNRGEVVQRLPSVAIQVVATEKFEYGTRYIFIAFEGGERERFACSLTNDFDVWEIRSLGRVNQ